MTATPPKFIRPGRLTRWFNTVLMAGGRAGLSLAGSRTLTVLGRTSGQPRSTPVNPLLLGGVTYLVAARGTTEWVRNLRVAGAGELTRGRTTVPFTATELSGPEKLPVLRRYLAKWAWEVGAFFDLPKRPTDEQILAVADDHPVFRIVPGRAQRR